MPKGRDFQISLAVSLALLPILFGIVASQVFYRIIPRSSLLFAGLFFTVALFIVGLLSLVNFANREHREPHERPWTHYLWNVALANIWTPALMFLGWMFASVIQADPPWPIAVAFVLGAGLVASPLLYGFPLGDVIQGPGFLRGRQIKKQSKMQAEVTLPPGDEGLMWGGVRLPSSIAVQHFLVVGATGSGKTVTLQLLMQSTLPRISPRSKQRAFLYDAKCSLNRTLRNFNLRSPVHILNPFDERGVAWDIAKDVIEPEDAMQLATMLVPRSGNETQPFFPNAAIALLDSMTVTLQRTAPGKWTLRDLLCAVSLDAANLARIVKRFPDLAITLQPVYEAKEFPSVRVTLPVMLKPFYLIAAAWHVKINEGKKISLNEWNESESILLLPSRHTHRAILDPLNQVLLRRLFDILLSNADKTNKRTWVYLDELAQLGRLDTFPDFLANCRSKGVSVAAGIQDIAGLQKKDCYTKEETEVITNAFHSRAFLRVKGELTAEWSAKQIGEVERMLTINSFTSGASPSQTQGQHFDRTTHVLPSQLRELPANQGYYDAADRNGAWYSTYDTDFLKQNLIEEGDPDEDYVPLKTTPVFQPWTASDLSRLGLDFLDLPSATSDPVSSPLPSAEPSELGRVNLPRRK